MNISKKPKYPFLAIFTPKQYQEFQAPQKLFEYLATPKNTPILYIDLKKKTYMQEMTPKCNPILWWPPKNIHKISIPPLKYSFFWTPPK